MRTLEITDRIFRAELELQSTESGGRNIRFFTREKGMSDAVFICLGRCVFI